MLGGVETWFYHKGIWTSNTTHIFFVTYREFASLSTSLPSALPKLPLNLPLTSFQLSLCPVILLPFFCFSENLWEFSPFGLTKRVITLPKVWRNWHCQASKLFSDGEEFFCFASCLQYRAHIAGVHQPLQINLQSPQDTASLFVSLLFFFSVSPSGSTGWKCSERVTLHAVVKQLVQVLPSL